jgi:hypothetical protein
MGKIAKMDMTEKLKKSNLQDTLLSAGFCFDSWKEG